MTFWDWLWLWTRDPVVWDWMRPTTAALVGAVIGGAFTLLGQRQSAMQLAKREDEAARRGREAALRDQSREGALALFSAFTELHREIQVSDLTIGQHMNGLQWAQQWRQIWTKSRSLDLDVGARLLTDATIRGQVQLLVQYLDYAEDYADGPHAPFGGFRSPLHTNLHYMVSQISGEGVEVIGAYLRGEAHTTTRARMWADLAIAAQSYADWDAYQAARAEEMNEEMERQIEHEERDE